MSIKNQGAINATETVKVKLTFEREAQSQLVVINGYHTDNGVFNYSEFMEEMLKKQQNIRLSAACASHQNGSSDCAIKPVVTMERTMLMHAALRCPEENFSLAFGQWQWIMLYGSTIGPRIFNLDYLLLKYGQGECLNQC